MGVTSSRIEDDKALLLCRERKRFLRQALDGRCALAASHVSYIQSLRNIGEALRKFVEPEFPVESSLCTSTSATPEPLALTDKSASQLSNSSPSFSQYTGVETVSPLSSSPYSGGQVNYMKSSRILSKTVEEGPPVSVTVTIQTSPDVSSKEMAHSADTSALEDASVSSSWDYFSLFNPIDDQFSFHDGLGMNRGFMNGIDVRGLREEEGIPELEEEENKVTLRGMSECQSEDEFDKSSSEPLVRIFKNRNQTVETNTTNGSPTLGEEANPLESAQSSEGNTTCQNGVDDNVKATDSKSGGITASIAMPLVNGKVEAEREHVVQDKVVPKDFYLSLKEIELLFVRASESGTEVPRMLEANKVGFRPIFSEGNVTRTRVSAFFTAILVCCKEEIRDIAQEPATSEVKYLTWHRSMSSCSSSSRIPIGATLKDDIELTSSTIFSNTCMNSGSHASTLDRLYAWERKLYDEVKVSGIIRREYDNKCRLLRHQESKGEKTYMIDKTRATVKDLHSRIRVALQRINSISRKLEELRDKELHPQLEELIGGLSRMWEIMHDCHKLQYDIVSVAYNNVNTKFLMRTEYHHQAAMSLEAALTGLNLSFSKWIEAHKSYLQSINGWLLKCFLPVKQSSGSRTRRRNTDSGFNPRKTLSPPIYVTCGDWLDGLCRLPVKPMEDAMTTLVVEVTYSLLCQDKDNRKSKLSSKFARGEDVHKNEHPVDWGLCLDNLQRGLKYFLDQLNTFAGESVTMYRKLGKDVEEFRQIYDNHNPGSRVQMPSMAS